MIDDELFDAVAALVVNDPTFAAAMTPQSRDELHAYISREYGYVIPRQAVCEGHCAPFDAIADAFFGVVRDAIWVGPRTGGKGQPISANLATPTGWARIGDVSVGDEIVGADGSATVVTAVFERGVLPVFRVTFSDGASLVVDGDHLWALYTRKRRRKGSSPLIISTRDLMSRSHDSRDGALILPMVRAVQRPERSLRIDPYVMGALLANGYLDMSCFVSLNGEDDDIAARLASSTDVRHRPYGAGIRLGCPGLAPALRSYGLYGSRSATKYIPEDYLYGSISQRVDLLHGLMDCDGGVDDGCARYSTTSEALARDVVALIQSLGGTGRLASRSRDGYIEHRINVMLPSDLRPFWSQRKATAYEPRYARDSIAQPTRSLVSIEPAGNEAVRCISVAASDSLYVTENYIVTHNTLQFALLDHLLMKHFATTIANVGAIEEQAKKCYSYITEILAKPQFAADIAGESLMSTTSLKNGAKVEILPATMGRVNSPHPERAHWDEIELTDWSIIQEGLSMPVRTNGRPPATIYTSSRKKAYGPMERLLEQAAEDELHGRKALSKFFWCVFEILEQCPEERHQNGAPTGCGSCQLADVCRERTTDQMGFDVVKPGPGKAARSRGWMPIQDVIDKFIRMDRGVFDAQWLSLRPETSGLAYPMFNESIHVIEYEYNAAFPVVCGIDFGYTNPSVALYAQATPSDDVIIFAEDYASGRTADVFAESIKREKWFENTAWRVADTAARGDRETLISHGVANEAADKSSSIMDLPNLLGGIALCRWSLRPMGRKTPIVYFSNRCRNTIKEIKKYHNPDQKEDRNADERPVKSDDHAMDAWRYMMTRLYRGMLNIS